MGVRAPVPELVRETSASHILLRSESPVGFADTPFGYASQRGAKNVPAFIARSSSTLTDRSLSIYLHIFKDHLALTGDCTPRPPTEENKHNQIFDIMSFIMYGLF